MSKYYAQKEITTLTEYKDTGKNMLSNLSRYTQNEVDNAANNLIEKNNRFVDMGIDYTDIIKLVDDSDALLNVYLAKADTDFAHVTSAERKTFVDTIITTKLQINNFLNYASFDNTNYNKDTLLENIATTEETLHTAYNTFYAIMYRTNIDITELEEKLNTAKDLLDKTTAGTKPGNVPEPYYSNLSDAINRAEDIINGSTATQDEIDQAITDINTAMDEFLANTIGKNFTGYYDADTNKFYGVAPDTGRYPNANWVPANVIDGIYISPEPMPENINDNGIVAINSLRGYYLNNSIITPDIDNPVVNNIKKKITFGNIYFSTQYNCPIIYASGTVDEATEIYEKFTPYFANKGLDTVTINDELYFSCERVWYDYKEETATVIPKSDYYLTHIEPTDGKGYIFGQDVRTYFGCLGVL